MTTGYIYGLYDPRDGELRYVGQSWLKPRVRLNRHVSRALHPKGGSTHKVCWIKGLHAAGLRPELHILQELPVGDLDAAETYWIKHFRELGCRLTNMAEGGLGWKRGYKHTEETKRKMSQSHKTSKLCAEHLAKLARTCRRIELPDGGWTWEYDR